MIHTTVTTLRTHSPDQLLDLFQQESARIILGFRTNLPHPHTPFLHFYGEGKKKVLMQGEMTGHIFLANYPRSKFLVEGGYGKVPFIILFMSLSI